MITKRIVFCLVLLFVLPLVSMAAMTQSASDLIEPSHVSYLASGNEDLDKIYIFCAEVETILEAWTMAAEENDIITFPTNGATISNATDHALIFVEKAEQFKWVFADTSITASSTTGVVKFDWGAIVSTANQMLLTPSSAAVGSVIGTIRYDTEDNKFYGRSNAGEIDLGASAASGSLDAAYGTGSTIDVDTAAVTLTTSDTDDNAVLVIVQNDSTNDPDALQIDMGAGSTGSAIDIDGQTSGTDIMGTGDLWSVSGAGAISAVSISVTNLYENALVAAPSGNVALSIDGAGNGTVGINQTGTGDITLYRDTVLSGALDVAGATTLDGAVTLGDATGDNITITGLIVANVTLDDGTTDSPSFILKDATDETCAIVKLDNGDTTVTIPSDTDFEIVTGNLAVGDGSPGTVAMDGEDFYVNGDSEFDGAVQLDGAVTFASTLGITGTATIGTANITVLLDVDEEIDIDFDNADEEMSIVNSAEYGADGAQVTIENTDADVGAAMYLLRLRYTDDGQANADFAVFEDNNGDDMIAFTDGGGILAAGTIEAATIRATTLLDVDEAVDIDLNANDEEVRIDSTAADYAAGSGILEIYDDSTGQANASYLLRLAREADGDAQDHFILCEDNSDGSDNNGDDMFKVDATGAVTIAGALTASGSITGDGGDTLGGYLFTTTDDTDNETLLVGDSGEVFTNQGDANTQVYTLPAAVDGVWYIFADIETAGNADLCILAVGDDTINGGSAAEYYNCYNDTVGDSVTLVAISATEWIVISKVGTWTNDSDTTAP